MKVMYTEALNLIKAGLESGSIKLRGASDAGTVEGAKEQGAIDAAYIRALLKNSDGQGNV